MAQQAEATPSVTTSTQSIPRACPLCRKRLEPGQRATDSKYGVVHADCGMEQRVVDLETQVATLTAALQDALAMAGGA